jgi:hypothetical protein
VCRKLVGGKVTFGGPAEVGKARVFGLLRGYVTYGRLVLEGMEACGTTFAAKAEMTADPDPSAAAVAMATFQQAGVTTVIWVGPLDFGVHTQAAAKLGYFPEWMIAGARDAEGNIEGRFQDQTEWANARTVTNYTAVPSIEQQACYQAAFEGDPDADGYGTRNYACDYYPDLRQFFTGVQVAGPRLTVANIDRGFHAIPARPSADPTVPACFYNANDYTCMKDAMAEWWDPSGFAPSTNSPGCWRMMQGGRRYLAGTWPGGVVDAQRSVGVDACNAQAREPA